ITPGGTVTHGGLTFTWPDVAVGKPDNVVAGGQTIKFSGTGAKLGFLGTANNGTASGSGTITYTDGTTQPFTIGFPDWRAGAGDTPAAIPSINPSTGKQNRTVYLSMASVPLQPGKTVKLIALPDISQGVANGATAMHIFAIASGG